MLGIIRAEKRMHQSRHDFMFTTVRCAGDTEPHGRTLFWTAKMQRPKDAGGVAHCLGLTGKIPRGCAPKSHSARMRSVSNM